MCLFFVLFICFLFANLRGLVVKSIDYWSGGVGFESRPERKILLYCIHIFSANLSPNTLTNITNCGANNPSTDVTSGVNVACLDSQASLYFFIFSSSPCLRIDMTEREV
uniref:Secreted protein n=1 Tax=Cacopsylla melanoneura TaxID=428564 RepID=A0A8D8Q210_9HEMI